MLPPRDQGPNLQHFSPSKDFFPAAEECGVTLKTGQSVTPKANTLEEITGGGSGMAFLRQEASVVERFRIIEVAEAESGSALRPASGAVGAHTRPRYLPPERAAGRRATGSWRP